MLTRLAECGLVKARGRPRTDSTHVLAAVRGLNRLEGVGETLRAALNALATAAPDWLTQVAPAAWYARYGRRIEHDRLPKTEAARAALAAEIGADGRQLFGAVDAATHRPDLALLPEVVTLRARWEQQYVEDGGGWRWRRVDEMPAPSAMRSSPYDPEARFSRKGEATWVGYKVQLTETCAADAPRVITHVATTPATTSDDGMAAVVQAGLAARGLLPAEHLVDKGDTDAAALLASERDHGVRLVGPVAVDPSWQARAGAGFAQADFTIDWERRVATCPAGKTRAQFRLSPHAPGVPAWEVRFARQDCTPCPSRAPCTRAARDPRSLTLLPQDPYEALHAVQRAQETDACRADSAARAGIESTHAQAIRRAGLRRCRYVGLAKTRLQPVATAVALNVVRIAEWSRGSRPAPTRQSVFTRLQTAA